MTPTNRNRKSDRRGALRTGFTIEEIFDLTKIDRWFVTQMEEIVDIEEKPAETGN